MSWIILVALFVFGLAVLLAFKYPVYGFMFGLTLFYNIGAYLPPDAFGMPGFFTILDLGLVFAVVLGMADRVVKKEIVIDNDMARLLLLCLLFSLYQIVVTIWIKLHIVSPTAFLREIVIHRWRIFGVYFAIPTYYIIQRYSREVYQTIVWVTGIVLILFFLTLLTPLNLIHVGSAERGLGATIQRTGILHYGYMAMCVPLALASLLLKLRLKYRRILLFCGLGMFVMVLMSLSRITIITLAGVILLSFFLVSKLFRLKLSRGLRRGGAFVVIGFIILILVSGLLPSLFEIFRLTLYEVLGKVPLGTTQSRTQFELVVILPLFLGNMFTGTGFLQDYFSSYHTRYELGLADLPILGNLAIYGLVGFLIYLARYFAIHKAIRAFWRKFRQEKLLPALNSYETVLLLWAIIHFYALIFFRFFMFSKDLVYDWEAVEVGFLIGVLYGLLRKYRQSTASKSNTPPGLTSPHSAGNQGAV